MLGGRNQYDEKVRKNNAKTEKRKYVITREKDLLNSRKKVKKKFCREVKQIP